MAVSVAILQCDGTAHPVVVHDVIPVTWRCPPCLCRLLTGIVDVKIGVVGARCPEIGKNSGPVTIKFSYGPVLSRSFMLAVIANTSYSSDQGLNLSLNRPINDKVVVCLVLVVVHPVQQRLVFSC